jgi:hypothetical protein
MVVDLSHIAIVLSLGSGAFSMIAPVVGGFMTMRLVEYRMGRAETEISELQALRKDISSLREEIASLKGSIQSMKESRQ